VSTTGNRGKLPITPESKKHKKQKAKTHRGRKSVFLGIRGKGFPLMVPFLSLTARLPFLSSRGAVEGALSFPLSPGE